MRGKVNRAQATTQDPPVPAKWRPADAPRQPPESQHRSRPPRPVRLDLSGRLSARQRKTGQVMPTGLAYEAPATPLQAQTSDCPLLASPPATPRQVIRLPAPRFTIPFQAKANRRVDAHPARRRPAHLVTTRLPLSGHVPAVSSSQPTTPPSAGLAWSRHAGSCSCHATGRHNSTRTCPVRSAPGRTDISCRPRPRPAKRLHIASPRQATSALGLTDNPGPVKSALAYPAPDLPTQPLS